MKTSYLFKNKKVIIMYVLSIIISILTTIASYKSGSIVQFAIEKDLKKFILVGLLVVMLYIVGNLISYARTIIKEKYIQNISSKLRESTINEFKLEYIESDSCNSGSKYVNMSISDIQFVEQYYNEVLVMVFRFINLIIISAFFINLHISIIFFVLFLAGVMIVVPNVFQKKLGDITDLVSKETEKFNKDLENYIGSEELLKNSNSFSLLDNVVKNGSSNLSKHKINRVKSAGLYNLVITNINVLNQILLIAFSSYLVYLGKIEIGMIFSITALAGGFFSNLLEGLSMFPSYAYLKSLIKKYNLDKNYCKLDEEVNKNSFDTVKFENVSYSYDKKLINFPDLNFEKNKKYVIVGASGSGKSTLVNVLNGNYKKYNGEIYIDGIEMKSLNYSTVKRNIATMSQNVEVLNGSIKYNIILNREFEEDKFIDVIKKANLYNVIEELEEKENTVIDSNSLNLSGGQIQRIALARMLYQGAPIIILDEGTSSLDENTSTEIEKILLSDENLTVIMITHHLNNEIANEVDEIIRL